MSTAPTSDAGAIAASIHHAERFGIVFDRHFRAVHGFFERRLGRDEADALTGEVFRIAFEHRHRYHQDRPDCRPWLYGIAANLVRRHHRSHARFLRALSRLPAPDHWNTDLADSDRRLDDQAIWPLVVDALGALRAEEREVVLLVAWENLSYEEAGVALGLPIGTVRSRLSRGRQRLRELLSPIGEIPVDAPTDSKGR